MLLVTFHQHYLSSIFSTQRINRFPTSSITRHYFTKSAISLQISPYSVWEFTNLLSQTLHQLLANSVHGNCCPNSVPFIAVQYTGRVFLCPMVRAVKVFRCFMSVTHLRVVSFSFFLWLKRERKQFFFVCLPFFTFVCKLPLFSFLFFFFSLPLLSYSITHVFFVKCSFLRTLLPFTSTNEAFQRWWSAGVCGGE